MKHIVVGVFLLLSMSCDQSPDKDLHYPVDKVQDVMIDLYVASEAVKDIRDTRKDSLLDLYRSQIKKIHDVEFDLIEKDIAVIRSNDAFYTEVHKVVNDSINNMEQHYQKITSPNKIKPIPTKKTDRNPKAKKQMKKNG